MSIFSFLKGVGDKLFGGGTAQAAQASAPTDQETAKALAARVQDLGRRFEYQLQRP